MTSRTNVMTVIIWAISLWLMAIIVVALISAFLNPTNSEAVIRNIGTVSSVMAGILAPIITLYMASYQQKLTADLEGIKTDYVRQVELLKGSLSENLEIRKNEIAGQVKAFDAMLTAAHFFYYVLRQQAFGGGRQSSDLLAEADKKAADASAGVWHLSEEDRSIWYKIYQRSFYMSDLMRESSSDRLADIFNKNANELGEAIQELEEAGDKIFLEAKRLRLSDDDLSSIDAGGRARLH